MLEGLHRPYKLLVVDDEEHVAPMFRQSMRPEVRRGLYQLLFAKSGVEALACLEREPDVDLVITDLNMPDMDGLTLLGELSSRAPDPRSVVMSAYDDMSNIRAAMALGAADFVVKPVDFDDMRETIARTLRGLDQWREALRNRQQLLTLRQELDLAGSIQRSVLPPEFPDLEGYEFDALVQPAGEVTGDFYDVMPLPGGRIGLVIADVSGKGVPAAVMMMATRTLIRGVAIGLGDPARVLSEVNEVMCRHNPQSMFVTLLFCIIEPHTGDMVYASAGHPRPLVVRANGALAPMESSGDVVLGLLPGVDYTLFRHTLSVGETLFLYTDGVTDAQAVDGTEFGLALLESALAGCGSMTASSCVAFVAESVREFVGGSAPFDDITCLAVRRCG